MCGRYALIATWATLRELFRLTQGAPLPPIPPLVPRYNIAPTQEAPVVRLGGDGGRELAMLRWGLVPPWADDPAVGGRMINARSEEVEAKPAYRHAFRRRRCLVPADGFYEWKPAARKGGRKRPYLIRMAGGEPMAFAGLWEAWTGGGSERLETFTILTMGAIDLLRPVHDRMPAIVPPEEHDRWLDPAEGDPARLKAALCPPEPEEMEMIPVGPRINSPRNDDPSLMEPAEPDDEADTPGEARLFG